ncbi:MAG: hypothetical protein NT166_02215 [Candidatus Aminicenantes bacterium]|nr:hypothetical protein [Candidatus Aminicenantes bacterium]
MLFLRARLADLIEYAKRIIDVVKRDTVIKTAILTFNWDDTVLQEGIDLQVQAEEMTQERKKLAGQQVIARMEYETLLIETKADFQQHWTFCTLLYKSFPLKLKELTLSDKRDRTINGWLIQTKTFYAIAIKDDDLVSKLSSRYGVTREKLQEILNKILRIEIAKEKHDTIIGESQDLTARRNVVLEKLDDWLMELLSVCELSLKNYPQQMEKLNVIVYSIGYKKKAKEKTKPAEENEEDEEDEEAGAEDDEKTDNTANDVPTTPLVAVKSAAIKTPAAAKKKPGSKKRKRRK